MRQCASDTTYGGAALPFLAVQASSDYVAPERFEYTLTEFMIVSAVLLGATFLGLWLARRYRAARDVRMTAALGAGWRFRSQLGFDAGDPYARFPGLPLAMPHDVREGQVEGFDVSYFLANISRWSGATPHILVQLPVDPPHLRYVAVDVPGVVVHGWGPRAAALLGRSRKVIVETAAMALLVRSAGASADVVNRLALDLARAVVDDAQGTAPPER